jgi:hypothetical protein
MAAEPLAYFEPEEDEPDAERRVSNWNPFHSGAFLQEVILDARHGAAEGRRSRAVGSDTMQLFDKTLAALEYLHGVNAELARALDDSKAATEAAEANALRWETYANAAVSRAKSAETAQGALLTRAEAAEFEAGRERDRADESEEKAAAALAELTLFKERLVMFFRKNIQILDVIETLNT